MTVRLTIVYGDSTVVEEFENFSAAAGRLADPWMDPPSLVVLQELDAPEPSTWGQVRQGDEVVAPDSSLWRCDTDLTTSPTPERDHVWLTSLDGQRNINFLVTPDMPIMRRPGVLSAAAQLLHDVGLWGGR